MPEFCEILVKFRPQIYIHPNCPRLERKKFVYHHTQELIGDSKRDIEN